MDDIRKTIIGATETTEGKIQHAYRFGILLPVRLEVDVSSVRATLEYQKPMRDNNGRLLYAVPGGGSTL